MEKQEFIEIFTPFCEYFNAKLNTSALNIYYHSLKHLERKSLELALFRVIQTYEYATLPKVATILATFNADDGELSTQAWDTLIYAIYECGAYKSVDFKDEAITHAVAHVGGWVFINNASEQDLNQFIQPKFKKAYLLYKSTPSLMAQKIYLRGLSEIENARENHTRDDCFLIECANKKPERIQNPLATQITALNNILNKALTKASNG